MFHLIGGLILAGLSYYFWFVIPKDADENSVRGFVKIFKGLFGVKGYIITAKVLAVFIALSSASEFYKFVLTMIN